VHDQRLRWAAIGGYVIAISGLVAALTTTLYFALGPAPWGRINDAVLLVMTLGLVPVMIGCYELGGRTPLWPARAALFTALLAVAAWSVIQVAIVAGVIAFDYKSPATGWFAKSALLDILIGAWLVGAPALAGPWLPRGERILGILGGMGWICLGLGILLGGLKSPLTYLGEVGYQLLFPIWGFLMARLFGRLRGS